MSPDERPGAFSLGLLTHKMGEARVLLEKLAAFRGLFERADRIVELGAGQGWASCAIAHEIGASGHTIVATDIASDAVVSHKQWEQQFGARITGTSACRSAALPFADASIDLLF